MTQSSNATLASNKKAFHDYFIEERYETGIELQGSEVKSVKAGHASIKECYVRIKDGQLTLLNMYIKSYDFGSTFNPDERRTRRLLMHKKEIKKLHAKVMQDGYTLVPISIYRKGGLVKIEIGLAKGKKNYDKRNEIAKKDIQRDVHRELKERSNKQ
jgi:SsrA-binding protein